uniref:hypothetical protein n=1 Tax=Pararhizobium sp. IMCC3301 TaxID=3067904 RepID=UPI002741C38D|nr:hypothetical protein [Pararhizobium sp. IMCC3301]
MRRFKLPLKLSLPVLTMLVLAGCNAVSSLNPISRKPVVDLSEFASASSTYCPKIELRQGTESFGVYERGFDGNRKKLVHQARIENTARECTIANGQLQMRIGINGRVLAGPSSASSSTISVPIRIAVVRFQDSVLYSQIHPVSVQISEFDKTPEFVSVVNVTVPYPADERDFIIYVGFDRKDDA